MKAPALPLLALLILGACTPSERPEVPDDPQLLRIADFQDHRQTDSLLLKLKSPSRDYRAASALALASVQDTIAAPALGTALLEDRDSIVQRNAAYALGQTGGIASVNALIASLSVSRPFVLRAALEALGKTVKKNDAGALRRFMPKDSVAEAGHAWGLMRFALRGLAGAPDILIAGKYLSSTSLMTRTGAAWFFARNSARVRGATALINAARNDPSPEVRMAAAAGLKRISKDSLLRTASEIEAQEPDFRVRINAVRALSVVSLDSARVVYEAALRDRDQSVAVAAAEAIAGNIKKPMPGLLAEARAAKSGRVKATLFRAALKTEKSPEVSKEVQALFSGASVYDKGWYLAALAEDPNNAGFMLEPLTATTPKLRTAAAEALAAMHYTAAFKPAMRSQFLDIFKKGVEGGDVAVIGVFCGVLSDPKLDYKSVVADTKFLHEARAKMQLPQDIESVQPLDEAIAYLEGKPKPAPPKNTFNHPINWDSVKAVQHHPMAEVETSKGIIMLRLLPAEAPGSAANFAELARKHYFDNKVFHRVVPNFVIQTGCKRGDGYGSEDYSIRSEFSLRRYVTGSVGMASAGKDTEGTQWFITLSPTPHLDGRYSIFAEVVKGMNVANSIEAGDNLIRVRLFKE